MKLTVFVLLLWAGSILHAQTYTATIDSITNAITPVSQTQQSPIPIPMLDATFRVYVSDTSSIQNVHLKIGLQDGAGDLYEQTIPTSQLQLLQNTGSSVYYFLVDAGAYSLNPPFVQAWLIFPDSSTSPVTKRQFVF